MHTLLSVKKGDVIFSAIISATKKGSRDVGRSENLGGGMSVRLWNFKDGGSLNASFLPKNQHAQRKPLYFENTGSTSLSKSAKIVLSKSIFYVKNQRNFFKKKSFKNINLGDHFL